MSPGERRMMSFITTRLASVLSRPATWGPNLVIEHQVLQLLEIRRVLLETDSLINHRHRLMRAFVGFIAKALPDATAEPLAVQLAARGQAEQFCAILKQFVDEQTADSVAEASHEEVSEAASHQSQIDALWGLLAPNAGSRLGVDLGNVHADVPPRQTVH